ncbi:MAG: PD40 domain-containing protein [Acidobacteriota bacterium]|nr:PD40 domain-containing protein [Acidobacteriota bacterium]
MFHLLIALATLAQPAAPAVPDAAHLRLSAPTRIVELDTRVLGGDITRLAWSPDGTQIYLRATRTDHMGNQTDRHYLVTLSSSTLSGLDAEPPWASAYWSWKSAPWSPGSSAFRIQVQTQEKTLKSVASPMGGSLAKGGPDTGSSTADDIAEAARSRQEAVVTRFHIGGVTVGQWTNEPARPGTTFGWSPANLGVIAFADRDHDRRLVILDAAGHKQVVQDTKDVEQPAWSRDGRHLVFLRKTGRKTYSLERIDVVGPQQARTSEHVQP